MHLNSTAITQMILMMQGTALVGLLIWEPLSRQVGKKTVFAVGTSLWILAEIGLIQLTPNQIYFMYGLAILAGLGMATSYFIPLSMLPEVADWDELQTGQRREGLFYSLMMFVFKVFFALSIFCVGQLLSWSGYQEGLAPHLAQPESALTAIRLVVSVLPVFALTASSVLMYFYPINKSIHEDTIVQLQQRRVLTTAASSK
jgi:GPH family glycoside/pentoside/hexuronide:cation symporter